MSASYWIKLYIEILNDPKMATLPDRLWRRVVELFLCAGQMGQEGHLPETQQLAWLLRMQTDDLELDLKQIATTGIIQRNGAGWVVTKFAKRQAATPANIRKRQQREREQRSQYYGEDVTDMSRSVTQINRLTDNRLTEQNRTEEAPPPSSLSDLETATAYSNLQDHTRQAALRLYQQVTTHPQPISKHLDEVARDMEMVLDYYGDDTAHAIQDGKRVFGRWCQTVGKNGKKYSPFTPGWISWWLEELAPRPAGGEVDTSKMTTEEYMQYLYSLEEAK